MLKNLLLVFVALVCLYLYLHPRTETRVLTRAAAPMIVQVPAPTPVPKLYYHSPLDASAMSTSYSTGTGYFSPEASSRFNGVYYGGYYGAPYHSGTSAAVAGAPVYVPGVSNTVIYNVNPGVRAMATPTNRAYVAGRLPTN